MDRKREAMGGAGEEDTGRDEGKGGKGKTGLATRGGRPAGRVKSEMRS